MPDSPTLAFALAMLAILSITLLCVCIDRATKCHKKQKRSNIRTADCCKFCDKHGKFLECI